MKTSDILSVQKNYYQADRMKERIRNSTYADEGPAMDTQYYCPCFVCGHLVNDSEAVELWCEVVDDWGRDYHMAWKVHEDCSTEVGE
jgi:hypothetical protein|tara:strand:- start:508 stop:768 length:261 start_codon:yes stop_codon:yes gene_type:complete